MFDKEESIHLKKNRRRNLTGKGTSIASDESLIIKPFETTIPVVMSQEDKFEVPEEPQATVVGETEGLPSRVSAGLFLWIFRFRQMLPWIGFSLS